MNKDFNYFLELHRQKEPLLIGNVWNVQSAKVFEELKLKAIATSSAAVAATLGYADGEKMSFEEYLFIIKRIATCTSLPLSVDLETGYGRSAEEVVNNIEQLIDTGVVGINIEDSDISNGTRSIVDASLFADKIRAISAALSAKGKQFFINIRTDAFLLNLPGALEESLKRIKIYENSGAHGLFFPCVTKESDIAALVKASSLPVHVMYMPNLPGFGVLETLGVKRISMANFMNEIVYSKLKTITEKHLRERKFSLE
jgi:2-methylisocitrate lyase-like PEP mutase family enzyme